MEKVVQNVRENGSEILKFNRELYDIFQNIVKYSFALKTECFVHGHIIQELLSKSKIYNPQRLIETILTCQPQEYELTQFFPEIKKIRSNIYALNNYVLVFYFLPHFSPYNLNTDNGFTIDQLYYSIKNNLLIDTSGKSLEHFSNPIILKTTANSEKWDTNLVMGFVNRSGFYYDTKIEQDDYKKLSKLSIERPNMISHLFWLNQPGAAIKSFIEICPQSKSWIFDTILKLCGFYNIKLDENIKPSKIFTNEKFRLLNLYGDYFINSAIPEEKREKIQTFIKLIIQ